MNGKQDFSQLHRNIFIVPVILITIAFLGLIKDFLMATFWAAVLSIIFFKLFCFLESRWKKPNLASITTLIIIILVVVIPVSLITIAVVDQSQELISEYNESGFKADSLIVKLEAQIPALEKFANTVGVELSDIEQQVRTAFMTASKSFANRAVQFTKNSLRLLLAYSIMLYLLFFFLRDGRMIVNEIVKSLPFGNDRERHLMELFASTSRATMKGTVIVACLQGTLGGLLF